MLSTHTNLLSQNHPNNLPRHHHHLVSEYPSSTLTILHHNLSPELPLEQFTSSHLVHRQRLLQAMPSTSHQCLSSSLNTYTHTPMHHYSNTRIHLHLIGIPLCSPLVYITPTLEISPTESRQNPAVHSDLPLSHRQKVLFLFTPIEKRNRPRRSIDNQGHHIFHPCRCLFSPESSYF